MIERGGGQGRQRVVGGGDTVVARRGRVRRVEGGARRCSPRRWRSTSGTRHQGAGGVPGGRRHPAVHRCPTTTRSPRPSSSSPSASWSQATFAALDRGVIEVYIPAYFKDFVTGKANNVEGFVAGTARVHAPAAGDGRRSDREHRIRSTRSPATRSSSAVAIVAGDDRFEVDCGVRARAPARARQGARARTRTRRAGRPGGRGSARPARGAPGGDRDRRVGDRRARCARGPWSTACARRCCSARRIVRRSSA